MITLPIADWRPGVSDGMVFGSVLQTLLGDVVYSARLADDVAVVLKDVSTGKSAHEDVSALANGTQAGGFSPFSATAQMSLGDGFFVACNAACDEMFLSVDIAGVGGWAGLQLFDSTDGRTATRQLVVTEDGTNGLKISGVNRIAWTNPTLARQAFSPAPGDLPERRYIFVRPGNFTTVTTAPHVARVWVGLTEAGVTWFDGAASGNADMADGAFPTIPDAFPQVGMRVLFRVTEPALGLDARIHRRGPQSLVGVWEYLGANAAPIALADVVDPSNGLRNGPVALGGIPENFAIRWSVPASWPSQTLSIPMSDGSTKTMTGRFFQIRAVSVSPYGPISNVMWRHRARQFGIANTLGLQAGALSVRGLALTQAEAAPTVETRGQVLNLSTGNGVAYVIPANAAPPVNVTFAAPLTLATGEQLGVSCSAGSGLTGAFAELLTD